jgi:hypothetical protein
VWRPEQHEANDGPPTRNRQHPHEIHTPCSTPRVALCGAPLPCQTGALGSAWEAIRCTQRVIRVSCEYWRTRSRVATRQRGVVPWPCLRGWIAQCALDGSIPPSAIRIRGSARLHTSWLHGCVAPIDRRGRLERSARSMTPNAGWPILAIGQRKRPESARGGATSLRCGAPTACWWGPMLRRRAHKTIGTRSVLPWDRRFSIAPQCTVTASIRAMPPRSSSRSVGCLGAPARGSRRPETSSQQSGDRTYTPAFANGGRPHRSACDLAEPPTGRYPSWPLSSQW